jgi:hypothetical protein
MSSISIYICEQCNKSFSSAASRAGHMKVHAPDYEQHKKNNTERLLKMNSDVRSHHETEYYKNPKLCLHCEKIIPYSKDKRTMFCSRSCSCTYNNFKADYSKVKETWKKKVENNDLPDSMKSKGKATTFRRQLQKGAPYSILYNNICLECGTATLLKYKKRYCSACEHLYSNHGRAPYWFTFNIYDYPDLFDLDRLTTIGFYHHANNKNGLTRDHKISVNSAIKNKYDPYYIKHPLNCELLTFDENNKKNTRCSISYEDLVKMVDEYEKGLAPAQNRTENR